MAQQNSSLLLVCSFLSSADEGQLLMESCDQSVKLCVVVVKVILKIGGILFLACDCYGKHFRDGCHVKLIIKQAYKKRPTYLQIQILMVIFPTISIHTFIFSMRKYLEFNNGKIKRSI